MSTDTFSPAIDPPGTAGSTWAAVQALLPVIATRVDEIEHGRRIPPDLVDQLRAAGCFGLLVPRSHRGSDVDLAAHLRIIRALARADGSVGWTTMIGSLAPVVVGMAPPSTFDRVYRDGPDVVLASAFNPTGVATPVEGGFRVRGRWTFASGCEHADWFVGHCVVDDGREPPLRMAIVPAADMQVVDTWRVSGLCGTGSHDVILEEVHVADDHTFSVFDAEYGLDTPVGRIPELALSSLAFAHVAVGIAEGALAEITTVATTKVPAFADAPLAANALFRYRLGEADAQLRAAIALLDSDVASVWQTATAGNAFTDEQRARLRATAVWVATAAARVVDTAYTAGGGSALYSTSPLQRRLRDVHAVTQHFALKPDTFTLAGAVLVGQDVDLSFL